jgi:hypothetical protein
VGCDGCDVRSGVQIGDQICDQIGDQIDDQIGDQIDELPRLPS